MAEYNFNDNGNGSPIADAIQNHAKERLHGIAKQLVWLVPLAAVTALIHSVVRLGLAPAAVQTPVDAIAKSATRLRSGPLHMLGIKPGDLGLLGDPGRPGSRREVRTNAQKHQRALPAD